MADDIGNIYQKQRERLAQQGMGQEQQAREAIKRRFASLGGLQSGAGVKAEEEAAKNIREGVAQAQEATYAPEAEFKFRQQEAERGGQQFEKQFGLQQQQAELAKQQFGLQKDIFQHEKGSKLRELDLAEKAFGAEREDQAFNKALSAVQAGVPFDLGDYLASIGFNVNQFRQGGPRGSAGPSAFERRATGAGAGGAIGSSVGLGSVGSAVGGLFG